MEISFGHYPGYLAKSLFIDFCKKNGVIIKKEYLDFLLENGVFNPEKMKTDDNGNFTYSLQRPHIIGVIMAMKNLGIKTYNFLELRKTYIHTAKSFFKDLDKTINIAIAIDKLINGFFVFKYNKLEEFQNETSTIQERNEKWDDYIQNSEDFDRLGFTEYLEDGCKKLMKDFGISIEYIDFMRRRIASLTFFNRNELDKKSKIKYLKAIDEDDLINSEYLNELIYKINLFSYYLKHDRKTVREVLMRPLIHSEESVACSECGRPFIERKGIFTCSTKCSNDRKNRIKRENRAKVIHTRN